MNSCFSSLVLFSQFVLSTSFKVSNLIIVSRSISLSAINCCGVKVILSRFKSSDFFCSKISNFSSISLQSSEKSSISTIPLIYAFLIRSFCFINPLISLSISSVFVGLWSARIGKKYFLTAISYSTKSQINCIKHSSILSSR